MWLLSYFYFYPSLSLVLSHHPITLLSYADKRIVNTMKVYITGNKLQLELILYHKNVDIIHVFFREATDSLQYHPPNAYREVSNTNHFGTVSDSQVNAWLVTSNSNYSLQHRTLV